jgi:hypothetical protein
MEFSPVEFLRVNGEQKLLTKFLSLEIDDLRKISRRFLGTKIPRVPRDKLVICGSMVSDAKRELTRGSVFLS